jgi:hypothetical protein
MSSEYTKNFGIDLDEIEPIVEIFTELIDIVEPLEEFLNTCILRLDHRVCSCHEHRSARNYVDHCRQRCSLVSQRLSKVYLDNNHREQLPASTRHLVDQIRLEFKEMMHTRILPKLGKAKTSSNDCFLKGDEGHTCC